MSPAYICIFDLQSGAKVVVSSNFCKTQFVCKSIDALCCLIIGNNGDNFLCRADLKLSLCQVLSSCQKVMVAAAEQVVLVCPWQGQMDEF